MKKAFLLVCLLSASCASVQCMEQDQTEKQQLTVNSSTLNSGYGTTTNARSMHDDLERQVTRTTSSAPAYREPYSCGIGNCCRYKEPCTLECHGCCLLISYFVITGMGYYMGHDGDSRDCSNGNNSTSLVNKTIHMD
jgi:hypothetical protein